MNLSDDDVRWLVDELRDFAPAREMPTAHALADELEATIGMQDRERIVVMERGRAEVVAAVDRVNRDDVPPAVLALRNAWA